MGWFNNSQLKTSDNADEVNGNPYIEVTTSYYNSSMYEEGFTAISNLNVSLFPVFNCIPKVVNISSALSTNGNIEPISGNTRTMEIMRDVIYSLGLEQEKLFIARDLILGKSVLLELQMRDMVEDKELALTIGTDLFPYAMSYYSADQYEIIRVGDNIYQCSITGTKLMFDEENNEYSEKEVIKTYIRKPDGTVMSYEEMDGEILNEIEYNGGIMPLVEITTTYDMKQLFFSIDRYNELDTYISKIFYLCGEPILTGTGVSKLSDSDINEYTEDRYNTMKTLFAKSPDATLKYIELQGTATSSMISKQEQIKKNIIQDFPEYAISEVLSGGNVSAETTRIRLTEVLSRIQNLRENIEIGLNAFMNIVVFYMGGVQQIKYISLGDMMQLDIETVSKVVERAMKLGLISKESAMFTIKDLYIGNNVSSELERLESEVTTQTVETTETTENEENKTEENLN